MKSWPSIHRKNYFYDIRTRRSRQRRLGDDRLFNPDGVWFGQKHTCCRSLSCSLSHSLLRVVGMMIPVALGLVGCLHVRVCASGTSCHNRRLTNDGLRALVRHSCGQPTWCFASVWSFYNQITICWLWRLIVVGFFGLLRCGSLLEAWRSPPTCQAVCACWEIVDFKVVQFTDWELGCSVNGRGGWYLFKWTITTDSLTLYRRRASELMRTYNTFHITSTSGKHFKSVFYSKKWRWYQS